MYYAVVREQFNTSALKVYKLQKNWPNSNIIHYFFVSFLQVEGCRVISATDPHCRHSRFSRPESLLYQSNTSSIILKWLSWTPLNDPLLRKPDSAGKRTRDLWICTTRLPTESHGVYFWSYFTAMSVARPIRICAGCSQIFETSHLHYQSRELSLHHVAWG
jgi:hypothetical protein